jgi:hypothetical protein
VPYKFQALHNSPCGIEYGDSFRGPSRQEYRSSQNLEKEEFTNYSIIQMWFGFLMDSKASTYAPILILVKIINYLG